MKDKRRALELLAPAGNAETAIQAILHGADAVYMGPPSHGARKSAANSLEDIRKVVDFAHQYRARVYATVNTLIYEHEINDVRRLVEDLWKAGVDAIIAQDMALLEMDLPPIAIHASTQCDTRTPEKARFLQDAGCSQIVLARELTLDEIRAICKTVSVPVECFVHGALCVSYSGRCHASQACMGRSANRGECAQMCRLPYTLKDADGRILASDKYLLSLKDFNTLERLEDLVEAGVSSFKIEGRLKESGYVKNIVAAYRRRLDEIIAKHPDLYRRASYGTSDISFTPQPDKSFNRGFTDYFLTSRRPTGISNPHTPKSMGEEIADVRNLNNGDGISFFNNRKEWQGGIVNGIRNGRIESRTPLAIPRGATIYRTYDRVWQQQMERETASRKIDLDVMIDPSGITASDERGVSIRIPLPPSSDQARSPRDYRPVFEKLGNTVYRLRHFESTLSPDAFYPASLMTALRRRMVECLDMANRMSYPMDLRRKPAAEFQYPCKSLDYRDNVANSVAEQFYRRHGVEQIERALETSGKPIPGTILMTTRHCILRELGLCLREKPGRVALPLSLITGRYTFTCRFDCSACEMQLLSSD